MNPAERTGPLKDGCGPPTHLENHHYDTIMCTAALPKAGVRFGGSNFGLMVVERDAVLLPQAQRDVTHMFKCVNTDKSQPAKFF